MIVGLMVDTLIAYYLNSYWSGRFIGYSFFAQIKDIFPSLLLASVVSAIVFIEALVIHLPPLPLLVIQLITGTVLAFGICEAIQFKDYVYIKSIVTDKFLKTNH